VHAHGQHARARRLYEDALRAMHRGSGIPQAVITHAALGWVALEERDRSRAHAAFTESVALGARLGHREALVAALEGAAGFLSTEPSGRLSALRLFGATDRLRASMWPLARPDYAESALERARAMVGEPRASALLDEGRSLSGDAAAELARSALAESDDIVHRTPAGLTPREREVAVLLARGCSNRDIAEALVVGQRTAEMHVSNLLSKLGLTSRSQVAVWAVQAGLQTQVP
jgi:DNA-binding CsgD family transcriptional regulator